MSAGRLRQDCRPSEVSCTSAPTVPSKPVRGQAAHPATSPVRWTASAYACDGAPVRTARKGAVPVSLQTGW
ncbi:hypothetical protein ADK53_06910 [Streptomyces sp. WM6373]|nr:hypothetical protein ADK53_06910 [Streptomyces sp. WM6373]